MQHKRLPTYLVVAVAAAAVLALAGVPLAALLPFAVLLLCPLMMFFMMGAMAGMGRGEDHTGHGCEHDPTRLTTSDRPEQPQR